MIKQILFVILIILVFLIGGIWYNRNRLANEITVTNLKPNQTITSPLQISGQAPGSWFFEAQAPVKLVDSKGEIIASGQIKAQGNWQTTNLVPFFGTLVFDKPADSAGQLILEKDNPSGLPENSEQITIPVRF